MPSTDPAISDPEQDTADSRREDAITAWLVIARTCVDKPVDQWRSCGQGRWVTPSVPALFASLTPASALLEALVNQDLGDAPGELVLIGLTFPAGRMLRLDTPPELWRERPWRADVRRCGDRWALEHQSLALRVPSALCPGEYNVLLNSLHPDFVLVERGEPEPFAIEPRLRRGGSPERTK